jgi:hypothetical protein
LISSAGTRSRFADPESDEVARPDVVRHRPPSASISTPHHGPRSPSDGLTVVVVVNLVRVDYLERKAVCVVEVHAPAEEAFAVDCDRLQNQPLQIYPAVVSVRAGVLGKIPVLPCSFDRSVRRFVLSIGLRSDVGTNADPFRSDNVIRKLLSEPRGVGVVLYELSRACA